MGIVGVFNYGTLRLFGLHFFGLQSLRFFLACLFADTTPLLTNGPPASPAGRPPSGRAYGQRRETGHQRRFDLSSSGIGMEAWGIGV